MNKERFAHLISFVFHPVIFSLLVPFLIVYKESASISYGLKWVFFYSFFLFLAAAIFFIVRPKNVVKDMDHDFDISHKENRHIFYSICALMAVIYYIVSIIFKGIFFPLSLLALGVILGILIFDLVDYYIKASVHAAVATAYIVTVGILYGLLPFFGVAWILLLIVWSRLYLKKHTKQEIAVGILLGLVLPLVTFLISRQISL